MTGWNLRKAEKATMVKPLWLPITRPIWRTLVNIMVEDLLLKIVVL